MTTYLYRWGRFAAGRPWAVIGGWLIASILVVGASIGFGSTMEDSFAVPGLDSQAAVDLLQEAGADGGGLTAKVVATPVDDGVTFADPAADSALAEVRSALADLPNVLGTTQTL